MRIQTRQTRRASQYFKHIVSCLFFMSYTLYDLIFFQVKLIQYVWILALKQGWGFTGSSEEFWWWWTVNVLADCWPLLFILYTVYYFTKTLQQSKWTLMESVPLSFCFYIVCVCVFMHAEHCMYRHNEVASKPKADTLHSVLWGEYRFAIILGQTSRVNGKYSETLRNQYWIPIIHFCKCVHFGKFWTWA